jgi:hypothetical protein
LEARLLEEVSLRQQERRAKQAKKDNTSLLSGLDLLIFG